MLAQRMGRGISEKEKELVLALSDTFRMPGLFPFKPNEKRVLKKIAEQSYSQEAWDQISPS